MEDKHYRATIICRPKDWLKKTYRAYDGITLNEDYEKGPLGYKVILLFPQMQLRKFQSAMQRCAGIVSVSLERSIVKDGIIASFGGGIVGTGSVAPRRLPRHVGTSVDRNFTPTKDELDKILKPKIARK